MVFKRDNWTCMNPDCNKSKSEFPELELHCHHIDPVINNPIESADIDNCITLCKECHINAHKKTPGCGYAELRC